MVSGAIEEEEPDESPRSLEAWEIRWEAVAV